MSVVGVVVFNAPPPDLDDHAVVPFLYTREDIFQPFLGLEKGFGGRTSTPELSWWMSLSSTTAYAA